MGHGVSVAGRADGGSDDGGSAGPARPGQDEGLEEIEIPWGVPADGEVPGELAAADTTRRYALVLVPIDDVGLRIRRAFLAEPDQAPSGSASQK